MNSLKLFVEIMLALQILSLLANSDIAIKIINLVIISWAVYLVTYGVM